MPKSTSSTIVKNKEEIKSAQVAQGISRLSSSYCNITEQMETLLLVRINEKQMAGDITEQTETLLLVRINEKQMAGDSVCEVIICEKAKQLFEELRAKAPSTRTGPVKELSGTKDWYTGFRKRTGLHSVLRHGEAVRRNRDAADQHRKKFKKITEEGGFVSQQVFNCDKTGLFWNRMPCRTYTMKDTTMPGHKPMKDQLTSLFCANDSGDCKVKPLLSYHSENPTAFKNIRKNRLGDLLRSNHKAWVTRSLFSNRVTVVFGPTVHDYLRENDLPWKVLLVMDNAPAHPPKLMEEFQMRSVSSSSTSSH